MESNATVATDQDRSGRWPANVIHNGSSEVLEYFSRAVGQIAPSIEDGTRQNNKVYAPLKHSGPKHLPRVEQSRSATRFFYCAKASKSERGESNNHPTVKPLALMRYLCRLVIPPGGIILDPFAGSGSTLLAARQEGFNSIGIEQSKEYCDLILDRLGQKKG